MTLTQFILDGRAYCLDCLELLMERQRAIFIWPAARWELPGVFEDR